MSMRIWLPGVLGLVLVGMIALMAAYTTSRGRSTSRHLAALAVVEEVPRLVTPRTSPPPSWAISAARPAPTPVPDRQQAPAGEGEAGAVEASPQAGERDEQVAKLRASGPDPGSLTAKVKPLQETWETMAKRSGIEVDVAPWECYGGGCFTTVVHQAPPSVEELTSKILASQELASWPGPQTRSAPISRTDGTAEVTWFLLTPQPAGQ
jgi:hypothetical protein